MYVDRMMFALTGACRGPSRAQSLIVSRDGNDSAESRIANAEAVSRHMRYSHGHGMAFGLHVYSTYTRDRAAPFEERGLSGPPPGLSTQQPQASEDPMDKPLAGRRMHAHRRLHAREIVLHGKAKQPERHYDEDQAQIVHEVEPD